MTDSGSSSPTDETLMYIGSLASQLPSSTSFGSEKLAQDILDYAQELRRIRIRDAAKPVFGAKAVQAALEEHEKRLDVRQGKTYLRTPKERMARNRARSRSKKRKKK